LLTGEVSELPGELLETGFFAAPRFHDADSNGRHVIS
jgi:hypothetical protein